MYIRKKNFNNKSYYYLVQSKRQEGKVRQKVVRYLGKAENMRLKNEKDIV